MRFTIISSTVSVSKTPRLAWFYAPWYDSAMDKSFDTSRRHRLHSPERHKLLPPDLTLVGLGLKPGDHMVDVGCGTGFFSLPAADIVGQTGSVTAVDPSPDMLRDLEERAREAGAAIRILNGRAGELPLEKGSATFGLMVNVLHEVERPEQALAELFRVLVPGGIAAVVEWRVGANSGGPPPQHRLPVPTLFALLRAAGFGSCREVDAGTAHVGIRAIRGA